MLSYVLTNWKTTLAGILAAVLAGAHQIDPNLPDLSSIGALLLGLAAKDGNVTGGTVKQ